jgi:spore germination cell wall hydrolase CwlJ-like protein
MGGRWVDLARKRARKRKLRTTQTLHEGMRALGAAGVLVAATALNFALYPDAIASALGFASAAPSIHASAIAAPLDEAEVHLLAATAWAEARSEGEPGMRAVAHVIVNRVGRRFGDDLKTVILAPKQFSAWNVGDPNRPLAQNPESHAIGGANLETWEIAQAVAREVLLGQSADPTGGALFYHATSIQPWWSRYGRGRHVIGAHVFYRDVPDQLRAPHASLTQVADAAPSPHGPRAGRVNGVIQYAPLVAATPAAPAETTIEPPAVDANAADAGEIAATAQASAP